MCGSTTRERLALCVLFEWNSSSSPSFIFIFFLFYVFLILGFPSLSPFTVLLLGIVLRIVPETRLRLYKYTCIIMCTYLPPAYAGNRRTIII